MAKSTPNIVFEEDWLQARRSSASIAEWVVRKGMAKDVPAANRALIAVSLVVIALSVSVLYLTVFRHAAPRPFTQEELDALPPVHREWIIKMQSQ